MISKCRPCSVKILLIYFVNMSLVRKFIINRLSTYMSLFVQQEIKLFLRSFSTDGKIGI